MDQRRLWLARDKRVGLGADEEAATGYRLYAGEMPRSGGDGVTTHKLWSGTDSSDFICDFCADGWHEVTGFRLDPGTCVEIESITVTPAAGVTDSR